MNPQTYTITDVKETSLDPDTYGNVFYNVAFQGYGEPVLWKTKNRPEVGASVYGHMEPSRSGKSTIFKRDKQDDAPQQQNNWASLPKQSQDALLGKAPQYQPSKQAEIIWSICVKEAASFVSTNNDSLDESKWSDAIKDYANALYNKVVEPSTAAKPAPSGDVAVEDIDDGPVKLSEIPF